MFNEIDVTDQQEEVLAKPTWEEYGTEHGRFKDIRANRPLKNFLLRTYNS